MSKENLNEMTEKQQEIKKEDKKALKKFVVMLLLAFVVGIAVGVGSAFFSDVMEAESAREALLEVLRILAVYGSFVFTTALLICSMVLYKKSRREYSAWDEEDEEVLGSIETKLSYLIWFSNLILYGSYFFFSVGVWAVDITDMKQSLLQNENFSLLGMLLVFVHMGYALVAGCIIQQKAVNLTKELNPEKTGSIYDMKFQDKWLENCDEAERFTAYKCAFKSFKVMQIAGIILWIICLVGQMVFDTGVFATIMVTVVLFIQTSVYSIQGIYFAKHPSEVMK